VLNFHAVGDSHTVTNPLYGRGCSLALVQAVLLADAIGAHDDRVERTSAYEAACGEQVAPWWAHAVEIDRSGADPTSGDSPDQLQRDRLRAVMAASQTDPVIGRAMARLWNLLTLPAELNEDPEFVARVMTVMADPEAYPVPEPEGPTRELLLDAVVT
jgi:flavin-dependent dehydrogenase